jgi:hypothetical protein
MNFFQLNQLIESFDRLPLILRGLAAEARKAGSWDEFEKDFLRQIKHGLYWHWTEDPNFQIDPTKGPRDMSSMAFRTMNAGKLMITSHLANWASYGPGGKGRQYAAIIDMSEVPRNLYQQVSRGFGNEFFVHDPSKAKVVAVLPRAKAFAKDREQSKYLPQSEEELRKFYDSVT